MVEGFPIENPSGLAAYSGIIYVEHVAVVVSAKHDRCRCSKGVLGPGGGGNTQHVRRVLHPYCGGGAPDILSNQRQCYFHRILHMELFQDSADSAA